ncbi:MAG: hypothetical protein CR974_00750 [Gammaproteobacteria bacterium]|nr:MAG: hypothetical protein CR974_00750 [Gammaproteobacteria bacterium]
MAFIELLQKTYGKSVADAKNIQQQLRELEKYFDDNFEEGEEFARLFIQKFEDILSSTLGMEADDLDYMECFVANLYQQEEFKSLAINIIINFYNSGGDREFCDYIYEAMIEEMMEQEDNE